MKYYVVDAFADEVFKGNPAGVCILDKSLEDKEMQKIAAENNLSETAFVMKKDNEGEYNLRWFTPKAEINLCGHATLGTSYVISKFYDPDLKVIKFNTMSGVLEVECNNEFYAMNFPSIEPQPIENKEEIRDALGIKPNEVYLARDLFVVLNSEEEVKKLTPDFAKVLELKDGLGVIVTAKGDNVDFVSRCFYPKLGVNEDPVTGSAHSNLIPFWSKKLGKDEMVAKQLSQRGGTLYCKDMKDRVEIGGKVILYMSGNILY